MLPTPLATHWKTGLLNKKINRIGGDVKHCKTLEPTGHMVNMAYSCLEDWTKRVQILLSLSAMR